MSSILFRNARVLDVVAGAVLAEHDVLVVDGRIKQVSETRLKAADATIIDIGGRVLMPGLCDAHVHIVSATNSFRRAAGLVVVLRREPHDRRAQRHALSADSRRCATAGGADCGIAAAVEQGYVEGPRILFCGKALSQTGGHGDMRGPGENFDQCSVLSESRPDMRRRHRSPARGARRGAQGRHPSSS